MCSTGSTCRASSRTICWYNGLPLPKGFDSILPLPQAKIQNAWSLHGTPHFHTACVCNRPGAHSRIHLLLLQIIISSSSCFMFTCHFVHIFLSFFCATLLCSSNKIQRQPTTSIDIQQQPTTSNENQQHLMVLNNNHPPGSGPR